MRRAVAIGVILIATSTAHAHIGAVVANARFTEPATPMTTPSDGGVILSPFTIETVTAGTPVSIAWDDGDIDPTGRYFFYYMDHCPTFDVQNDDIQNTLGTAVLPPAENGIWASCNCTGDAGVICPDAGPSGRDCRNMVTWDTTGVPTGTYWIIAINNDPPYHVYSVASSPVRVSAGTDPAPPAVIVLRPDGYNAYDKSYRVQWMAAGTPPLKFDLAYGVEDPSLVLGPTTSLGNNVTTIDNGDGTFSWDWDISKLANLGVFYLRVTVTDGNGVTTYTDSRFGLSVFHPALDGGGQNFDLSSSITGGDMGVIKPKSSGCAMTDASAGLLSLVGPLGAALALFWLARRRARA